MKIVVTIDSDAHFEASLITNRKGVLRVLDACDEGGDYVEDCIDNLPEKEKAEWENKETISDDEWEQLLRYFVQRRTFEIIDLKP